MAISSETRGDRARRPDRGASIARTADRHVLYEASVQCVDADLDFIDRVYRAHRGVLPRLLREDFCGTAAMACAFVRRRPDNNAFGVDLHGPTLEWGIRRHVARLGPDATRIILLQEDVQTVRTPAVDAIAALNFSYWVFQSRDTLRAYFANALKGLARDGLFFLDSYGGTEAMAPLEEDRKIAASTGPDGEKVPAFTYVWQQREFNAVDHHLLCHIHFRFADGSEMKRAFTYDWRMWTLPELREILLEAGFRDVEVYIEGWDEEEGEGTGVYRRRSRFENREGWIGYVVALP